MNIELINTPEYLLRMKKKSQVLKSQKIEMVVFDLGGVLFDWNPRNLFKKIFKSEEKMEHFLTHICNHDWNIQQDRGRLFSEAIKERIEKFPEHENEIRAYWDRWPETLCGAMAPTVELLEDLKQAGNRLSALSNWSAETFPLIREDYDFLKNFEYILISGKEKLIKPDPAIYKLLLKRVKLKPQQCVFIDDVLVNIQGAQAVGIHGIQFHSATQVRQELENLDIQTKV
jgi:2-haloacid dehalogenase